MVVDAQSLVMSRSGRIVGDISLLIDGVYFPERQWSDFPAALLEMWLIAATSLREGSSREARFHFMDGPFWFDVLAQGGSWRVSCKDGRSRSRAIERLTADLQPRELSGDLISSAELVLGWCRAKGWSTADTNNLEGAVARGRSSMDRE